MLKISIPQPCHEDWNKMTPNEKGSFCNVCAKTVVDFTQLSDDEVQHYFLRNRGQKTCGRFNNTQLTQPAQTADTILLQHLPLWKKFLAIVIVCFSSFLTGCADHTKGKIQVGVIKKTPVTIDTALIKNYLLADTIPSIEVMGKPQAPVIQWTETVTKGEIMVAGGVMVEEFPPEMPVMGVPLTLPDTIQTDKSNCQKSKTDTIFYSPE